MQQPRRRSFLARGAPTVLLAAVLSACSVSATTGRNLPQGAPAAKRAATWLAGQVRSGGFVPTASGTGPDLSATAQSLLALVAADGNETKAQAELRFLESRAEQYTDVGGATGPGQLGILILDADSMGANPRDFGGTDLVAGLLATEQPTGPDAGMLGTQEQVADDVAGSYDQGIALAALAATGVQQTSAVQAAVSWLEQQQCPGGGWTLPDDAANPCGGSSPDAGPDTNTTAMAIQGLVAQHALDGVAKRRALAFLRHTQQTDGGWSYSPPTPGTATPTDPDSTALVIQALIASGASITSPPFAKGQTGPYAALLSFRVRSGPGAGALFFPPGPAPANIIATYQAIPALMGLTISQIPSAGSRDRGDS